MENKTPPIGDPNATATPAALAAVTISRILTEKLWSLPCGGGVIYGLTLTTRKFLEWPCNKVSNTTCYMYGWAFLANWQARRNNQWLNSFSKGIPHRSKKKKLTSVILLIANVPNPKNPCITKPARMHLISEMPDPAAYFARFLTRWAAVNENEV